MRPALSVILLTTLLGAGQGLLLAVYTGQFYAAFEILPPLDHGFAARACFVALGLLVAGLVASFFHLGHPERAWRAAAQWRTSWLSREVVVLPALMGVAFLEGAALLFGFNPVVGTLPGGLPLRFVHLLAALGTLLAFTLFLCTAMIYACLRFLREWASPLTVLNYTLLGSASGFTLAAALAATGSPGHTGFFAGWAIVLTLAGLLGRSASLWRNARLKPRSNLQTAIGIKHPDIVQKTQGAMGGSFNTREFFHGRTADFLRSVKWVFLAGAFVLPVILLFAGWTGGGGATLLSLAFLVQYLGLLAERWFFFAQANHPQNLYYQCVS